MTENRPDSGQKRLIVVGDRVLIAPEEGEDRSRVGLYLPPSAVDAQAVQTGTVVAVALLDGERHAAEDVPVAVGLDEVLCGDDR